MDWFLKLVRIAGVNFPGSASMVQLQAEIDSGNIKTRLKTLENPISQLHEDIPEISKQIYAELKDKDSVNLDFEEGFYRRFSHALAVLNTQGLISKDNRTINLIDPSYIIYMCTLAEEDRKMQEIMDIVGGCEIDQSIDAKLLTDSLGLPKYVISAVFQIYEAKDYGYCSGGFKKFRYTGKVLTD